MAANVSTAVIACFGSSEFRAAPNFRSPGKINRNHGDHRNHRRRDSNSHPESRIVSISANVFVLERWSTSKNRLCIATYYVNRFPISRDSKGSLQIVWPPRQLLRRISCVRPAIPGQERPRTISAMGIMQLNSLPPRDLSQRRINVWQMRHHPKPPPAPHHFLFQRGHIPPPMQVENYRPHCRRDSYDLQKQNAPASPRRTCLQATCTTPLIIVNVNECQFQNNLT
jgi:hypothetical protein